MSKMLSQNITTPVNTLNNTNLEIIPITPNQMPHMCKNMIIQSITSIQSNKHFIIGIGSKNYNYNNIPKTVTTLILVNLTKQNVIARSFKNTPSVVLQNLTTNQLKFVDSGLCNFKRITNCNSECILQEITDYFINEGILRHILVANRKLLEINQIS